MLKSLFNKKYTIEMFRDMIKQRPPDLDEMQKAIDSGIDIDFMDKKGETFLHYTIKKNLTACAKFLIEHGINVNELDSEEYSPIYLAIAKSNRIITQALIDTKKINLNQLKDNRTLLQDAILQGERSIVNMLLQTNIDRNHIDNQGRNILFDAIGNGNQRIIEMILELDDLDANVIDIEGKTILHQSTVLKDDELAIQLIQNGADPTILDAEDKSYLLHIALRGGDTEAIIDAALEAGFNINSYVRNKNSILMEIMFSFAKLSRSEMDRRDELMAMASSLVKKGIDVNAVNAQGETVLFDAVRRLDIQACAFLLKEKTPVNTVNNEGNTVLSEIIYEGIQALDIVCLLLRHGADLKYKNEFNQTIIEVVDELVLYSHGNIENTHYDNKHIHRDGQYMRLLKDMLEMSNYSINSLTSDGEPLFFKSLLYGNRPLFTLYYNHGININAVNIRGNNIFARYAGKMASQDVLPKEYRDIIIMLIDKKVDINITNKDGKSILSQLVGLQNMHAFRILLSVTKFDLMVQDNRGFTIIHDCISSSNVTVIRIINQIEPKLKNVPDNIGLLPIAYAALFGNLPLVLLLMDLESNFTSNKILSNAAKMKFKPLLANLSKLESEDANINHKLDVLKEQIIKDFQIIEEE